MSPSSPSKLVQPAQSTWISFDQALSNKQHSSLVIRPPASKKIPNASVPSKLHDIADSNQPILTATPSRVKLQIALLLSNNNPDSVTRAIPINHCTWHARQKMHPQGIPG